MSKGKGGLRDWKRVTGKGVFPRRRGFLAYYQGGAPPKQRGKGLALIKRYKKRGRGSSSYTRENPAHPTQKRKNRRPGEEESSSTES